MVSLTGEDLSSNYDLLTKSMHLKIAGVAGLGAQNVSASISIEKDIFQPGDSIPITVDIDNSKCRKNVKSYKFKLARRYECYPGNGQRTPLLVREEYLATHKTEKGCAKKTKEKASFKF